MNLKQVEGISNEYLSQVYAYANRVLTEVPFYSKRSGTTSISSYTDFLKLPIISKEDYRNQWEELINPDLNKDALIVDFTSGSTGKPLKVARTLAETNDARKTLWKYRQKWLSNALSAKRAEFGRNMRYFLKNPNELFLAQGHVLCVKGVISKELAPQFVEKLNSFKPEWIIGPASFLAQFARLIKGQKLEFKIKLIECTGEFLFEHLREEIMEVFNCPVVNHYGARELWPIAFECTEGKLHINQREVFVEILKDGNPVEEGEFGEVVVSSLRVNSLPLLRYRLGDIGCINKKRCSCGDASYSLELMSSRISDYALTKNGVRIGAYFFSTIFVDQILRSGYRGIQSWQVIQKDYSVFHVFVCNNDDYDYEVENIVSNNIEREFGPCDIKFEYVNQIPIHESGKMKYFVSEMPEI